MTEPAIPPGFKPYRGDGTFNDVIAPVYMNTDGPWPVLGMRIEKKHCSFMGVAHGGCLMSLLDIALSGAVCSALGQYTTTPTVNISTDFMAAAKVGDWVQVNILSVDLTRTLGFVNAVIEGPDCRIARTNGCFKLPNEPNTHPTMPADEYHRWRIGADVE